MKQIYFFFIIIFLNNLQLTAQTTDLITGLSCPCALAFKGDELYFSENVSGKISKINVVQNSPAPISVITGLKGPSSLAFKGNELYIGESSGNKISKIDVTNTTPVLTNVISGLDGPYSIAIKDNELFITEFLGKISKINISTTSPTPTTLWTLGWQNKILFNKNDLYIAEFTVGKISKIDVTSSMANPQTINYMDYPSGITFDNDNLFISQYYENKVSKKDMITLETKTLSTGLNKPTDLAIKDNVLYIVELNKITKLDLSKLSVDNYNSINTVKLFPNPSQDIIQLSNLTKTTDFKIYNTLGEQILKGAVYKDGFISIKNLDKGVYFLNLDDKNTLKFIKK